MIIWKRKNKDRIYIKPRYQIGFRFSGFFTNMTEANVNKYMDFLLNHQHITKKYYIVERLLSSPLQDEKEMLKESLKEYWTQAGEVVAEIMKEETEIEFYYKDNNILSPEIDIFNREENKHERMREICEQYARELGIIEFDVRLFRIKE